MNGAELRRALINRGKLTPAELVEPLTFDAPVIRMDGVTRRLAVDRIVRHTPLPHLAELAALDGWLGRAIRARRPDLAAEAA